MYFFLILENTSKKSQLKRYTIEIHMFVILSLRNFKYADLKSIGTHVDGYVSKIYPILVCFIQKKLTICCFIRINLSIYLIVFIDKIILSYL